MVVAAMRSDAAAETRSRHAGAAVARIRRSSPAQHCGHLGVGREVGPANPQIVQHCDDPGVGREEGPANTQAVAVLRQPARQLAGRTPAQRVRPRVDQRPVLEDLRTVVLVVVAAVLVAAVSAVAVEAERAVARDGAAADAAPLGGGPLPGAGGVPVVERVGPHARVVAALRRELCDDRVVRLPVAEAVRQEGFPNTGQEGEVLPRARAVVVAQERGDRGGGAARRDPRPRLGPRRRGAERAGGDRPRRRGGGDVPPLRRLRRVVGHRPVGRAGEVPHLRRRRGAVRGHVDEGRRRRPAGAQRHRPLRDLEKHLAAPRAGRRVGHHRRRPVRDEGGERVGRRGLAVRRRLVVRADEQRRGAGRGPRRLPQPLMEDEGGAPRRRRPGGRARRLRGEAGHREGEH
eukprot:gene11229-biopygen4273